MSGGPESSEADELAWIPSSVGAAGRHGTLTAADLHSGRAWSLLLAGLAEAGEFLHSDRMPPGNDSDAAGYRHLMVLLALGIDEALRSSDPYEPAIRPGNVDNVLKWGMDCPDALYSGASIRPDATYRIWGHRGSARFLHFQVMAGIGNIGDVVAEDLTVAPDGTFELFLSPERRDGNWLPLAEGASSLVIRQFFYDWAAEQPASLQIECLEKAWPLFPRRPTNPAADEQHRPPTGSPRALRSRERAFLVGHRGDKRQGAGGQRLPACSVVRSDIGGATDNVTVWGSWELAEGEALIVEMTPPPALYWSISIGNQWWETIDYAGHQSSLNGHQAVLDDGVFRAVVEHGLVPVERGLVSGVVDGLHWLPIEMLQYSAGGGVILDVEAAG